MTRSLREGIHIHAPAAEVHARLVPALDGYGWLPPAFAERRAEDGALSFRLALPLRDEAARLVVGADDGRSIEFIADGASTMRALTWVVNAEGPREVHLLAEAVYEPAGGPLGWLLELALHRPLRQQALREALWRLKLTVEGRS